MTKCHAHFQTKRLWIKVKNNAQPNHGKTMDKWFQFYVR